MAEYWGGVKSISSYIPKAMAAAAPVGGVAATGVPGVTAGAVFTGGTLTTVGGAGVTTVTTTVTIGGAGAATAGAAAAALGAGIGIGIGQVLGYGISHFWDPVAPAQAWDRAARHTGADGNEIDALLCKALQVAQASGAAWAGPRIGMRDVLALDRTWPAFGTTLARFMRSGVSAFVDMAQGAAAASAGEKAELRKSARALQSSLGAHVRAMRDLASVIAATPAVEALFPPLSLPEYLWFVDENRRIGALALPELEELVAQMLFDLSRVRHLGDDVRTGLAKWIAEGPGAQELAAFQAMPGQALSFAKLLSGSADWGWSAVDLVQSPLLKGLKL